MCKSKLYIIGMSLNEPHTSETALHMHLSACLLAAIYCKFYIHLKYFINNYRSTDLASTIGCSQDSTNYGWWLRSPL